eukprot:3108193-Alexandrium_andersonii.AAC.1
MRGTDGKPKKVDDVQEDFGTYYSIFLIAALRIQNSLWNRTFGRRHLKCSARPSATGVPRRSGMGLFALDLTHPRRCGVTPIGVIVSGQANSPFRPACWT